MWRSSPTFSTPLRRRRTGQRRRCFSTTSAPCGRILRMRRGRRAQRLRGRGRGSSRSSSGAMTMATSNRERVDAGVQLLQAGLLPFVDAAMSAQAPGGQDWVAMLEARDTSKNGTAHKYSRQDPRFLLKVVTEEWRVFGKSLSRAEQSFASELRETGNRLAHNEPFSTDDTYRALDTMERLLSAVDATAEADAVRKLRRDGQ